jgi:FAD/FMN-containing dehydrogenase
VNETGIIINMRRLNRVDVDLDNGSAVIGGGATVVECLRAAKESKAHLSKSPRVGITYGPSDFLIVAGTCNSVGAVPSMIGGGLGNMMVRSDSHSTSLPRI